MLRAGNIAKRVFIYPHRVMRNVLLAWDPCRKSCYHRVSAAQLSCLGVSCTARGGYACYCFDRVSLPYILRSPFHAAVVQAGLKIFHLPQGN